MSGTNRCRSGQALIMVTLALIAMSGILGLAVDLGWSFYVQKTERAAADAGALAAIVAGVNGGPGSPPFSTCPAALTCTTAPTQCSAISNTTNLWKACLYAQQNGFTDMNAVLVDADIPVNRVFTPLSPLAGTVHTYYWVTLRVNQKIPQLFSAVLGNTNSLVSARATAALTDVVVQGSLILLNRQNDPNPTINPLVNGGKGVDLIAAGTANPGGIQAPGGILISSNACGQFVSAAGCQNPSKAAAQLQGTSDRVTNTSFTYFRGDGGWTPTGNPTWTAPPQGNKPDGPFFYDPFAGKGQPPLQNISMPTVPVFQGKLAKGTYGSGIYYATNQTNCGTTCAASGDPIALSNGVTFSGGNFGQFIFYGGLDTAKNGTVTFNPGTYVMAGTTSPTTPTFNMEQGSTITDGGTPSAPNNNAGELFIFTDPNYPGLAGFTPAAITAYQNANTGAQFQFGFVGMKSGNNGNLNLHGLNDGDANLPANMDKFAPVLFWQDQQNSTVAYDTQGNIIFHSPADPAPGCAQNFNSIDNPCPGKEVGTNLPLMTLDAHANINLYGAIYQPRGAWITMLGNGGVVGPLQIVTGAIYKQGGPQLLLQGISNPITSVAPALIE